MSCLIIIGMQLKAQNSKFSLGVMSSLDFYKYKYNDNLNTSLKVENFPCYHLGLKVQYDFNENFSLRSGISFSKIKYKWSFAPFIAVQQDDPILIDSTDYLIDRIYFINIPLMLGYTVYSKGNFKFTPSFGYILNFRYNFNNTQYSNSRTNSQEIKTIYAYQSLQLNLGCEYLFAKKFLLTFEPYLNYKFKREIDNGFVVPPLYSYGGILSINYKF